MPQLSSFCNHTATKSNDLNNRHILSSSTCYCLITSPLAKDQTRVTFDLSVPSNFTKVHQRLNKRQIKDKFMHSLLQYPIYCNGSCFTLQVVLNKKNPGHDNENGQLNCPKRISPEPSKITCVTTLCTETNISEQIHDESPKNFTMIQVYTDFISPRPKDTAKAIAVRLNQRFLNQVHEYENIDFYSFDEDHRDESNVEDKYVKTGIDVVELCIIS